ncbi:Myotubularin-related protein 4 [Takifugu flavidus]|uniref:phosphatidylinositol-3,5-bisphosphate 3-phosphatase n=1 Tax=Takifugu flavidus TaxID=433684 RepID=A0A5C6P3H9_9TELE|nr:Myotubularin-related protein 4 [Takifugu flavidus]
MEGFRSDHVGQRVELEVKRMGFDTQNIWRVSDINSNYNQQVNRNDRQTDRQTDRQVERRMYGSIRVTWVLLQLTPGPDTVVSLNPGGRREHSVSLWLCSSYPQKLLVPIWITDKELESVASFRSWKRIPVVVYRHQRNGAVIARCSQPEISWWGWRNTDDEYLVTSIAKACQMGTKGAWRQRGEAPESCDSDFDSSLTGGSGCDDSTVPQKLLILDARSYTAAVANRAKGGGCECEEYYPNCEVMFMGMANIHAIRNSFQALRTVCSQIPDPGNWLSALESTRWLQHLSVMLKAATLVCSAVEREGRPVLVHCSDGWDRTPQIVALAKILLDPYYRTIEGFQVLVEIDWLDYGHKFGDRCGHQENTDDVSEQCPVFLQWLDCVHQLLKQFPCLFEFNEAFLVKLVQHTYSCLYGSFLCNNARERQARNIYKRTCSVWSLLRGGNKNFQNFLYIPSHDMVLQPVCHTRALQLWTAVYLPTSSPCTAVDDSMELYLPPSAAGEELSSRSLDRLPKTRSMDNLLSAFENGLPLTRTSSDPNLNQHCQEGPSAPEPPAAPDHAPAGLSDGLLPDAPLDSSASPDSESCADPPEDPCLTTQPLPSPPLPSPPLPPAPLSDPLVCQQITHPAVPPSSESPSRTAESAAVPSPGWEPSHPLPCSAPAPPTPLLNGDHHPHVNGLQDSADLLALKQVTPLLLMEDSTETLTGEGDRPPTPPSTAEPPSRPAEEPRSQLRRDEEDADGVKEGKHLPASSDSTQNASGPLVSQSHLSDLSILGSHWDSILVQSAYSQSGVGRVLQPSSYQMRRPGSRLARGQGLAPSRGPSAAAERPPVPAAPSRGRTTPPEVGRPFLSTGSPCKAIKSRPRHTRRPPPPAPLPRRRRRRTWTTTGCRCPWTRVQQRLRQIEAGYKQEVEVLRQQVRQLQMRLESKQYSRPPSEPDVDYEDDITCLRESDHSNEEDSLSTHSEDRLSEGSWDRVEPKDTEVTRWVPDHMASHCFSCDCEFWIAKRRHHCRNCGNVFCKDCCHLKLPIPDQQLYDPVLVCNTCHDLLLESRTREIRSQQLKKAIATASS